MVNPTFIHPISLFLRVLGEVRRNIDLITFLSFKTLKGFCRLRVARFICLGKTLKNLKGGEHKLTRNKINSVSCNLLYYLHSLQAVYDSYNRSVNLNLKKTIDRKSSTAPQRHITNLALIPQWPPPKREGTALVRYSSTCLHAHEYTLGTTISAFWYLLIHCCLNLSPLKCP